MKVCVKKEDASVRILEFAELYACSAADKSVLENPEYKGIFFPHFLVIKDNKR